MACIIPRKGPGLYSMKESKAAATCSSTTAEFEDQKAIENCKKGFEFLSEEDLQDPPLYSVKESKAAATYTNTIGAVENQMAIEYCKKGFKFLSQDPQNPPEKHDKDLWNNKVLTKTSKELRQVRSGPGYSEIASGVQVISVSLLYVSPHLIHEDDTVLISGSIRALDIVDFNRNYLLKLDSPTPVRLQELIPLLHGPSRGIVLELEAYYPPHTCLEFELYAHTKDGAKEQLIKDFIDETWLQFKDNYITRRFVHGNNGVAAVKAVCFEDAVEAALEMKITPSTSSRRCRIIARYVVPPSRKDFPVTSNMSAHGMVLYNGGALKEDIPVVVLPRKRWGWGLEIEVQVYPRDEVFGVGEGWSTRRTFLPDDNKPWEFSLDQVEFVAVIHWSSLDWEVDDEDDE